MTTATDYPVALITGASRGLGRALALALASRGWDLVIDARSTAELREASTAIEAVAEAVAKAAGSPPTVTALAGSVTDPGHRRDLAGAVAARGRLDLLANNASLLGPSPQPRLAEYPLDVLSEVYGTNVLAPLAVVQAVLPLLRDSGGLVIDVSSDAAVEPYPGWGGYGSSKAALDQLTAVLAAEEPLLRGYAVDPGDMRTRLQQEAFPGEDISDRPEPEAVVPALLRLIDERPPSGRYVAARLLERSAS